jgi:hypothetical protein
MKLTKAERILALSLVLYIVIDILLTPLARLETRNPANITVLGIATLVLLFIGLALSVVAITLLFSRSKYLSTVAVVGGALYFPAAVAEWTGTFSAVGAPTAIQLLELAQAVVAVIVIGAAFRVRRGVPAKP